MGIKNKLEEILENLDGQSIKISFAQKWVWEHRVFIKSIAHRISNFIINKQNENKKKLHAIYLINEVLFKNYNPDTITVAFKPYLGVIHKAIYQFDDEHIQVQMRKLFTFWGDRKLFSLKTIGDNITVAILPHLLVLRVVVS